MWVVVGLRGGPPWKAAVRPRGPRRTTPYDGVQQRESAGAAGGGPAARAGTTRRGGWPDAGRSTAAGAGQRAEGQGGGGAQRLPQRGLAAAQPPGGEQAHREVRGEQQPGHRGIAERRAGRGQRGAEPAAVADHVGPEGAQRAGDRPAAGP